jgi:hypothetical protein
MAFRDWLKRLTGRTSTPSGGGQHRRAKGQRKLDIEELRRKAAEPAPPRAPPPAPKPKPQGGILDFPDAIATRAIVGEIRALGIEHKNLDADALITDVGASNAHTIVSDQLSTAQAYADSGRIGPGNERFADQVDTLERMLGRKVRWEWLNDRRGRPTYRIAVDYVQWFYYHAIRRF